MQVVAAVLERQGCILIGQRRRGDPHPLKWEFPGGKVEPAEAPADALVRELREELGIQATGVREIKRYLYQYPERPAIELIFFAVSSFDVEPRNLAFERIVWEARAHLQGYDFLEGDLEFVREEFGTAT